MASDGGDFELVEHRGPAPGPTVTVIAGVHGDEEEGVAAVQLLDRELRARPPARGLVRTVAVANPSAYTAARRTGPHDGRDLARSFPGDLGGSETERLAFELTERAIRGSDLLVDLHSAGRDYSMPTFVGYVGGADETAALSRRAARAYAAPLIWEHPPPVASGRSISAALENGAAAIYAEGSGGGSLEWPELRLYFEGVLRVLAELGVLEREVPAAALAPREIGGGGGDLDGGLKAPVAGRFVAVVAAGDRIAAGESIGEILGDRGAVIEELLAPCAGTVMFLRRAARISAGEVVCSIAAEGGPGE